MFKYLHGQKAICVSIPLHFFVCYIVMQSVLSLCPVLNTKFVHLKLLVGSSLRTSS